MGPTETSITAISIMPMGRYITGIVVYENTNNIQTALEDIAYLYKYYNSQ